MKITIENHHQNQRLDVFLKTHFSNVDFLSRNFWIQEIKKGEILVNEKHVNPSYLLKEDDVIFFCDELLLPPQDDHKLHEDEISNFKLEIIAQDENKIVLNKPIGLSVWKTVNDSVSLETILLNYYPYLKDVSEHAGIIHRLDKATTGLIIVAKTKQAFAFYQNCFKERFIDKFYLALLTKPLIKPHVVVDVPLMHGYKNYQKMVVNKFGKRAISHFYQITFDKGPYLVLIKILTGRTHQIRAHANYIKTAVLNDPWYHLQNEHVNGNLVLHAYQIALPIYKSKPPFAKENFTASLSDHFLSQLKTYQINIDWKIINNLIMISGKL